MPVELVDRVTEQRTYRTSLSGNPQWRDAVVPRHPRRTVRFPASTRATIRIHEQDLTARREDIVSSGGTGIGSCPIVGDSCAFGGVCNTTLVVTVRVG